MTTLHEENGHAMSPLEDADEEEEDEEEEEEGSDKEVDSSDGNKTITPTTKENSPQVEVPRSSAEPRRLMSSSRTLDSLSDVQIHGLKMGTPSTSSSGYGSAAVSTSNLLSEDSLSVRSISVDESPELEAKPYLTEEIIKHPLQNSTNHQQHQNHSSQQLHVNSQHLQKQPSNLQQMEPNSQTSTVGSEDNFHNKTQKAEMSASATDGSTSDSSAAVVLTKLPPGKVVRRRKAQGKSPNTTHRLSFPLATPSIETKLINGSGSVDRLDDVAVPDWVVLGESVQIRPYNTSGVVAFIGPTEFASGTWVGIELDAPTGKNDGIVQGVRYFSCKQKHGIFVRADKLILDKRGRAMRQFNNHDSVSTSTTTSGMRRSVSRGEGLSSLHRSRSRGEGMSSVGRSPRSK